MNNNYTLVKEITIKLPEQIYHTSFAVSVLLRYENYGDYVADLIQRDLDMIADGATNELSEEQLKKAGLSL